MQNNIPRPEYPRPQFVREGWMNLNGRWQFEIDNGNTGESRGLVHKEKLDSEILVPFCPESELSGVQHTDFMAAVWYRRSFTLPAEALGKRVILHFGAVDYRCKAWVNGKLVGENEGGYHSFSFEITSALCTGENTLVVLAVDDTRSGLQPSGKQSVRYESYACSYTRTTGIWQTVWLEWVSDSFIQQLWYTPDAAANTLHVRARLDKGAGCTLLVETSFAGEATGAAQALAYADEVELTVPVSGGHYWNVGEPALYDLHLTLTRDGQASDLLTSYFGLRSVGFDGMRFTINHRPVFQRLVLDQGFYPDGIYTAPTDEALKHDIELSLAMGFNGARLHQKIFEPRFLYHADKLGYLCWGEMANWGLDHSRGSALGAFFKDWLPSVERDFSAPSIIGWCPFNETWDYEGRRQRDDVLRMTYRITKALDPTRPCIDTSGNYHVETDIYDVHDYEQQPEIFRSHYGPEGPEGMYERMPERQAYGNQPMFVSEYGGIWWSDTDRAGWGYGERVKSREEFVERFRGLTDALLDNPNHFGLCYTQLTDVEQEQNGLYTYQRVAKFAPELIQPILARKAACEK
ncbi:MAG: beta-galactosidase [Clostridia bacterium]